MTSLSFYDKFGKRAEDTQNITRMSGNLSCCMWVSASSEVLYENIDLYEDGDCMRICIRTRVMRLMSGSAYVYAYGRLDIYGLWVSSRLINKFTFNISVANAKRRIVFINNYTERRQVIKIYTETLRVSSGMPLQSFALVTRIFNTKLLPRYRRQNFRKQLCIVPSSPHEIHNVYFESCLHTSSCHHHLALAYPTISRQILYMSRVLSLSSVP